MAKFQNKYRNESARAQWWNYANDGAYFVTICTAGREWLFGEILNKQMHLSPIGEMVYDEWNISFDMRAELFCDTFVIMPNHIHAILRIENKSDGLHVGTTGAVWQTRFHDHIIRNDAEYQRIYNYIESNIENWEKDKFLKKLEL